MKARLFAAAPLSGRLRSGLAAAGRDIAERLSGVPVRPVPEAALHLTVRFYGLAEVGRVCEALEAALEAAPPSPAEPPRLRAVRFAPFPASGRARGAFAELDGGASARTRLGELRRASEAAARAAGLAEESRRFRPHATVARFGRPVRLGGLLDELRKPSGESPIARLDLLRSTLTPEGAVHTLVRTFSLAGAASSRKSASRSGPSRA